MDGKELESLSLVEGSTTAKTEESTGGKKVRPRVLVCLCVHEMVDLILCVHDDARLLLAHVYCTYMDRLIQIHPFIHEKQH